MLERLFYGLGVLLGLAQPLAQPELHARIYRDAGGIYLNAEVGGAFPEVAQELAAEGSEVALSLRAGVEGGEEVEALRSLRYDAASGEWLVRALPDRVWRLPSREAALVLASRIEGLRLVGPTRPDGPLVVRVSARPGLLDAAGAWHPAGILWGYAEPSRRFTFDTMVEIPR